MRGASASGLLSRFQRDGAFAPRPNRETPDPLIFMIWRSRQVRGNPLSPLLRGEG